MQGLLVRTRMRERFQEAESERLRRASTAAGSAGDGPEIGEQRGRRLATLAAALRPWLRLGQAPRRRVERGLRHTPVGG